MKEPGTTTKPTKPIIAICYDFDGTLSPKNMQEYGFFPALGKNSETFWDDVKQCKSDNVADEILAYMMLMIERAKKYAGTDGITYKAFKGYGKKIKLFNGVEDWFNQINAYGKRVGITIEHYIVSSGIREMIEGTSIEKYFTKIYACSFIYESAGGPAKWPAVAVNFTTKTQSLFRINKGILDDNDDELVNNYQAEEDRRIPFSRIIYIGDGKTDIPCMRLVKSKGGHSIAVYDPKKEKKRIDSEMLLADGRVNYVAPANYGKNSQMKRLVCAIIDKIAAAHAFSVCQKKLDRIDAMSHEKQTTNTGSSSSEFESAPVSAPKGTEEHIVTSSQLTNSSEI